MKTKTIIVIFLVTIIATMLIISGCSKKEPEAQVKSPPKSNAPPAFPEDEKGSSADILPTGKVTVLPGGKNE